MIVAVMYPKGHFRIYHNILVFNFSWDLRQIENNAYAKFWRDKKEYYGKFVKWPKMAYLKPKN